MAPAAGPEEAGRDTECYIMARATGSLGPAAGVLPRPWRNPAFRHLCTEQDEARWTDPGFIWLRSLSPAGLEARQLVSVIALAQRRDGARVRARAARGQPGEFFEVVLMPWRRDGHEHAHRLAARVGMLCGTPGGRKR